MPLLLQVSVVLDVVLAVLPRRNDRLGARAAITAVVVRPAISPGNCGLSPACAPVSVPGERPR